MDRRSFFQSALQATAVTALGTQLPFRAFAATAGVQGKSAEEVAMDEDFWTEIRNEFTTDRTVINMNNGYASPAPRTVQEAMRRYLDYSNMGPYHTMIRELEGRVETARRMIAETAGCDPEEIAITRNSSESLEIAQFGVDLKAGDEVLTTNQDYPRMLTTFQQRARREGIVLKTISFPVPVTSMDDLYRRFEQRRDAEDEIDPVVPHHQPHRADLPGPAHLRYGAGAGHPGDCGWRARLQPVSLLRSPI